MIVGRRADAFARERQSAEAAGLSADFPACSIGHHRHERRQQQASKKRFPLSVAGRPGLRVCLHRAGLLQLSLTVRVGRADARAEEVLMGVLVLVRWMARPKPCSRR